MQPQLTQDYQKSQNFIPPTVEPQWSIGAKIGGAIILGAQESVVLTGAHWVGSTLEARRAEKAGESFITEEEKVAKYGESLPYVENEYDGQTALRAKYWSTRNSAAMATQNMGMIPQFGLGIIGNSIDAPLMLIPSAVAVKGAQATKAATAAIGFRRSEAAIKGVTASKKAFGMSYRKMGGAVLAEQLAESQAIYTMSSFTGRDYGSLDQIMDVALGGPIAFGLNAPAVAHSKKVARHQARMISDFRQAEAMFNHGDFSSGVQFIRKYSEDLDLIIKESPEVSAILDKKNVDRTEAEEAIVEEFFAAYAQDIEKHKNPVETDPDEPIIEARARKEAMEQDRVLDFDQQISDPDSQATSEVEILLETRNELQNLEPSEGNTAKLADVEARLLDYRNKLAQEARDAITIVQEIFGIKAKAGVIRKINSDIEALGSVNRGSDKIDIGSLENWSEAFGFKTVAQTVFHEAMHVFSNLAPDSYNQLVSAIHSQPALEVKLNELIAKKGYDPSKFVVEQPSHLIEWAVTQESFWAALQKHDRTLFEKFKDLISQIYQNAVRLVSGEYSMTADIRDSDLTGLTTKELASKLGTFFAEVKAGKRAPVQRLRPLKPQEVNSAASKLDQDMAKDNADKSKRQATKEKADADRVLEESKGSEESIPTENSVVTFVKTFTTEELDPQGNKRGATDRYIEYKAARDELLDELQVPHRVRFVFEQSVDKLYNLNQRLIETESLIPSYFTSSAIPSHVLGNEFIFKDYTYFNNQVAIGKMSAVEAQKLFKEKSQASFDAAVREELSNMVVWRKYEDLKGTKSNKIKFLKTILDGRARKGVATKDTSAEVKILAQIQIDQGALRHALVTHGLYDLFTGVSTIGVQNFRSRSLHATESDLAQQVYGKKLKEAHDLFWDDLMTAAQTGEIPDAWQGVKPFEEVYEAFMATHERQRILLNNIGANVAKKRGFSGFSARWSDTQIKKVGVDQWRSDMIDNIDWEATKEAHGGILNIVTDDNGLVSTWEDFTPEKFLDGWLSELQNPDPKEHSSENIVKSFGKHRSVILKPESEGAMLKKYSGQSSLGVLYLNQSRHRSEMIGLGQVFGSRPIDNFKTIARRVGLDPDATIKKATIDGKVFENLGISQMMDTMRHLTGALDNPVDVNLADKGRKLRQASNIMFLPMSGISAITDIPMIALDLNQKGLLKFQDMGDFMDAYVRGWKRAFGEDRNLRDMLEAEGAGMDSALNAASARIALGDPNASGWLSQMNDVMFTVNGLNTITRVGQEAYIDLLTKNMARELQEGRPSRRLIQQLQDFGFTRSDVETLVSSVEETVDGVSRITAKSIQDPEVARKYREWLLQGMNDAVILPDVGAQAAIRFGTQAGTYSGESVRGVIQYASFPLAMTRTIMNKFMTTYGGQNALTAHQTGVAQMFAFAGAMLAMGYMATVIKDILRGREPMDLTNMSGKGWGRVISQSGLTGIFEQLYDLGTGNPRGAIAPLPATLGKAAYSGSLTEVIDDLRPMYGSAYPVIGPVASKMMGWTFGESLQKLQHNRKAFLESMYKSRSSLDTTVTTN